MVVLTCVHVNCKEIVDLVFQLRFILCFLEVMQCWKGKIVSGIEGIHYSARSFRIQSLWIHSVTSVIHWVFSLRQRNSYAKQNSSQKWR